MELLTIDSNLRQYKKTQLKKERQKTLPSSIKEKKLSVFQQFAFIRYEVDKKDRQELPRIEYFLPIVQSEYNRRVLQTEKIEQIKNKIDKESKKKKKDKVEKASSIKRLQKAVKLDCVYADTFSQKNSNFAKDIMEKYYLLQKLQKIDNWKYTKKLRSMSHTLPLQPMPSNQQQRNNDSSVSNDPAGKQTETQTTEENNNNINIEKSEELSENKIQNIQSQESKQKLRNTSYSIDVRNNNYFSPKDYYQSKQNQGLKKQIKKLSQKECQVRGAKLFAEWERTHLQPKVIYDQKLGILLPAKSIEKEKQLQHTTIFEQEFQARQQRQKRLQEALNKNFGYNSLISKENIIKKFG